jgi:hypothetical protein
LVAGALERDEDPRTHLVSYDSDRDEAVVSVHGSGAFPHVVSIAVALASPQFLDRVLPVSRLESISDPASILRDVRCVGWLSDAALHDGQVLRDALVDAGVVIQNHTRKLRNGEYEDVDQFRGEIMRLAHGLAGAITHLLNATGVDLVREIRVPGGLDRDRQLEPLAESIAISAAIQARYGAFACYRQLFEARKEKRESALTPDVDASDPFGELIGSYVIRGSDLHRLEEYLIDALESPADVHEDAPEISIPVSVSHATHRSTYATSVQRMCEEKNLNVTREAVSLFQALTSSPYATTQALQQLGREPTARRIHPDEIRHSLATLPSERILPDAPPTVSKSAHALLTASRPLTQTELAERAGISTRSVRNHAARLEAFGLIEVIDGRYRLALPFRDERGLTDNRHLPWYLTPNRDRDDYRDATEKGVLFEAMLTISSDVADTVLKAFQGITTLQLPPDVRHIVGKVCSWALPFLEVARALAADEPTQNHPEVVTIGAEAEQTTLPSRAVEASSTNTRTYDVIRSV